MLEREDASANRNDLDRRIELASRGYYGLPLDARVHAYATIGRLGYFRNKGILEAFQAQRGYFPFDVDEGRLTEELSEIVPVFGGRVVGRRFSPDAALHYIVDSKGLTDIFPDETAFAIFTGKVIGEDDKVLGSKYQDLAGLVIVQAKMRTPEAVNFKALHEINHVITSQLPNAKRRQILHNRRFETDRTTKDEVTDLIGLNSAILIDEAAACLGPYADSIYPGAFRTKYAGDVRDYSNIKIDELLTSIKKRDDIDPFTIDRIDNHISDAENFPLVIQKSVERLVTKLRNPEGLDRYGYAIRNAKVALQVLDFNEVYSSLVPFCYEILEPNRIRGDFLAGLAKRPK